MQDSSQDFLHDQLPRINDNLRLILPILLALNMTSTISYTYSYKHSRPCSLILIEISQTYCATTADPGKPFYWPVMRFPGSPFQACHVFLLNHRYSSPVDKTELLDFARTARKIYPSIFALCLRESLNQYTFSLAGTKLILAAKFSLRNENSLASTNSISIKSSKADYEGTTLIVTMCAACGKGFEYFRKTGTWNSVVDATLFELMLSVNGTYYGKNVRTPARMASTVD